MKWPQVGSKMILRRLVVIGAPTLIVIVCILSFFRVTHPRDVVAYVSMANHYHPVWTQFAFRRVQAGDDAAEFLRRFPPSRSTERRGETIYDYHFPFDPRGMPFTGITVVARNGHLVSSEAWSCTWQFTFFDQTNSLAFSPKEESP